MDDVRRYRNILFLLIFATVSTASFPQKASAFGIDLLGDIAQPLIAPAKEKMKSLLVYIWLQPYAGYGWGNSDQKRIASGGGVSIANGLSTDGFLYGARGGLLIMDTFRVGLDYSVQKIKRDTLLEGTSGGYSQQTVNGNNTMLGALIGFNIPFTPVQGFVAKYFKASVHGDAAGDGDGLGGGISFVLKNPFILSFETRKMNYSSGPATSTGKKADATFTQYYATLSFMLF